MISRLRLPYLLNLSVMVKAQKQISTTGAKFRQSRTTREAFQNTIKTYNSESAGKTFKITAAVASSTGLGILCYYAMKKTNDSFSIMNKAAIWPSYVRERIHSTYTYFFLSNVITAGSAVAVFRNPTLFRYASRATIPALVLGMVGVIGTGIVMRSIPYDGSIGLKHLAWMVHCGTLGFVVSPVCMIGGHAIQKAALYTLGIVGGLSAVAVTAPSDKFLYMGVPLGMGLGLVLASSIAGIFLNPLSRLGAAALSFQLYGGLVLFGGFLLYDTQNVVRRAELHPPPINSYNSYENHEFPLFDPINNSMGIYMDTLNIFIRLATILGMGGGSKKR